jgi:hypothetical protein
VGDMSRQALAGLAALAMGADVLLSSDDEDDSVISRSGSFPHVRATFAHATRYLSDLYLIHAPISIEPRLFRKASFDSSSSPETR